MVGREWYHYIQQRRTKNRRPLPYIYNAAVNSNSVFVEKETLGTYTTFVYHIRIIIPQVLLRKRATHAKTRKEGFLSFYDALVVHLAILLDSQLFYDCLVDVQKSFAHNAKSQKRKFSLL